MPWRRLTADPDVFGFQSRGAVLRRLPGPQEEPRTVSVMVAASNAPDHMKENADFVCDGTADEDEILCALEILRLAGSGTIKLSEGIFYISSVIELASNGITIIGSGVGSTALSLASGANCNMFKVGTGGINRCRFADFAMFGNATGQSDQAARDDLSGFLFPDGAAACTDIAFENIRASEFRHGAAMRLNNITRLTVNNVYCHDNGVGGAAFSCDGMFVGSCTYGSISAYRGYSNTDTGLALDGCSHMHVSNSDTYLNTSQGFALGQGSAYITYTGCNAHGNAGHGWRLAKFGGSATNNAYFSACTSRQNTGNGIDFTDHVGLVWEGGILTGNAVDINHVSGSSLFTFRPLAPVLRAHGYGTIASGSTTVDVTHGLGMTPILKDISVTPTTTWGNATKFWISNAGATTFRINLNVDPAATVGFAWQADCSMLG